MGTPRAILIAAIAPALAQAAQAASIVNSGAELVSVRYTERGDRREVILAPGEERDFCARGCFVTFPDGDMAALLGSESVTLNGTVKVVSED